MASRRVAYAVRGDAGRANAARRALLADLVSRAPSHVDVRLNTSSHTDEFIAMRLGLVPFVASDDDASPVVVRVTGRPVLGRDLRGALHPDAPVLPLGDGQAVDATLHFAIGTGHDHARFGRAVAVGMRPVGEDEEPTLHSISFETLQGGDDHAACWTEALDALDARLRRARAHLLSSDAAVAS